MNAFWITLLQQILVIALPPLFVAALVWLGTAIVREWHYLADKYPQWVGLVQEYAPVVVAAAEQLRKSGVLPNSAAAKSYALKTMQAFLNAHGLAGIDITVVEAAIEAEVNKLPPIVLPTPPEPVSTTPQPLESKIPPVG